MPEHSGFITRNICSLVRHLSHTSPGSDTSANPHDARSGQRAVDSEFAPGHETAFSDGYPLSLASEVRWARVNVWGIAPDRNCDASSCLVVLGNQSNPSRPSRAGLLLAQVSRKALEEEAQVPLDMNRFRANIVISGSDLAPFSEDAWKSFAVGSTHTGQPLVMESVKPCSRCAIPNVDQQTGETGKEPHGALMKFRTGKKLSEGQQLFQERPQWRNRTFFAWNLVSKEGVVRVGDAVSLLELRGAIV
jgi:uncharacterized protein YcbX